mmetsp:Transcript_2015/g.4432  ORF Transcript_2015/g.4432 Transcript_2015/m.4432 type:complete len:363 (+) Transcript_2015:488-1576(+)
MAQACLGDLWQSSDVDVFCSARAAPCVRSWLVEKAKCMFVGFADYRITLTDDPLLYTVDTKIHHVERWGSIIANIMTNKCGYEREEGKSICGSEELDLEALKETAYYKQVTEWGKDCQKNYVDQKWNNMCFDILGIDNESEVYNIKPKLGGDLPFDFDGWVGKIDLIIARIEDEPKEEWQSAKKKTTKKVGGKEITPFDLLDDFDISICKASFNGKTFRIPEPHFTFSRKSTMEPYRRDIVESYMKHFDPTISQMRYEPIELSALVSATIKAVRKEVPNAPFYKLLDFASFLPDRFTGEFMGRGFLYDPLVQAKYGAPVQFHNWTRKLVYRLRKYQERGIEVVGAPTICIDVEMDAFDITYV